MSLQYYTPAEIEAMQGSLRRFTRPLARLTRLLQRVRLPRHAREATLRHAARALPWSELAAVEAEIRSLASRLAELGEDADPRTLDVLRVGLRRAHAERLALLEARPAPDQLALPPLAPCPERTQMEDRR